MKITAETTLENIMSTPEGSKVLSENRVPCLSCPMAAMEINVLKLGEVCHIYQLDLDKILKELNAKK